jgi:hypothetical protein
LALSPMTAMIWRRPAVRAAVDQCGHQRAADAAAGKFVVDVHRILDRITISGARAINGGISVAGDSAVAFRDEIGQAELANGAVAACDLGRVGRFDFETRETVQHMVAIDRGYGGKIV